jgi:hypothetical protein
VRKQSFAAYEERKPIPSTTVLSLAESASSFLHGQICFWAWTICSFKLYCRSCFTIASCNLNLSDLELPLHQHLRDCARGAVQNLVSSFSLTTRLSIFVVTHTQEDIPYHIVTYCFCRTLQLLHSACTSGRPFVHSPADPPKKPSKCAITMNIRPRYDNIIITHTTELNALSKHIINAPVMLVPF